MTLSNTLIRATLPSGNQAVYEVQPQHLSLAGKTGWPLNQVAIDYGRQVAVKIHGHWYEQKGDGPEFSPSDKRSSAMLDNVTHADEPAVRHLPSDDTEGGAL